MFLQRNVEITTQRFDPLVTLADPFGTKLADEISAFKLMRENTAADPIAGLEHGYFPPRVFEFHRRGKARKPCADNHGRVLPPLRENGWCQYSPGRCRSESFQKLATVRSHLSLIKPLKRWAPAMRKSTVCGGPSHPRWTLSMMTATRSSNGLLNTPATAASSGDVYIWSPLYSSVNKIFVPSRGAVNCSVNFLIRVSPSPSSPLIFDNFAT